MKKASEVHEAPDFEGLLREYEKICGAEIDKVIDEVSLKELIDKITVTSNELMQHVMTCESPQCRCDVVSSLHLVMNVMLYPLSAAALSSCTSEQLRSIMRGAMMRSMDEMRSKYQDLPSKSSDSEFEHDEPVKVVVLGNLQDVMELITGGDDGEGDEGGKVKTIN